MERGEPVFELCLLRLSHWNLIVLEAVPKLRDKREAFGRRQTDDLVGLSNPMFSACGKTR